MLIKCDRNANHYFNELRMNLITLYRNKLHHIKHKRKTVVREGNVSGIVKNNSTGN